jgi:hypothetical protein
VFLLCEKHSDETNQKTNLLKVKAPRRPRFGDSKGDSRPSRRHPRPLLLLPRRRPRDSRKPVRDSRIAAAGHLAGIQSRAAVLRWGTCGLAMVNPVGHAADPALPWLDPRGEAGVDRRRSRARGAACGGCVRERRRGDGRVTLRRAWAGCWTRRPWLCGRAGARSRWFKPVEA